jgi:hypothetical protein
MTLSKADRAALRTPWRLRLFRARRLHDLRARAETDIDALSDLANELVVWGIESMRRERFDLVLVAAEESVTVNRRLAVDDPGRRRQLAEALQTYGFALLEQGRPAEAESPVVEAVELAQTLRAEGTDEMEPLIRSCLTVLAAIRTDASMIREVTDSDHDLPQ